MGTASWQKVSQHLHAKEALDIVEKCCWCDGPLNSSATRTMYLVHLHASAKCEIRLLPRVGLAYPGIRVWLCDEAVFCLRYTHLSSQ